MGALSNLKGVGPAMASAVLAAGCPELAPFMADEVLLSMEGTEGIDYTMKEYMKLVAKTQQCVDRLNEQGGNWTPHKVEMAVWTHYVARDLKPEILEDMPAKHEAKADRFNGDLDNNGASELGTANGEVSEKEEDKEEVQEVQQDIEPHNNGLQLAQPVLTNGGQEGQEEAAVPPKEPPRPQTPLSNGDIQVTHSNETSSEVPSEASESSEVSVENASTNGTTNGTFGEPHQEEVAQTIKNGGDRERVEASSVMDPVEPPTFTVIPNKRPLEEAIEEPEAVAPETKRVREEDEEASPPCPAPLVNSEPVSGLGSSELGPCQPQPQAQPIHTGGD